MMIHLNGLGTAAVVQASTRAGGPAYNYTPNPDNAGFICNWFGPGNYGVGTEAYWDCWAKYYTVLQAPPAPLPPTSMDPDTGIAMDPYAAEQVIGSAGEATRADAESQIGAAHIKVYSDTQQVARDAADEVKKAAGNAFGLIPWYVWLGLGVGAFIIVKKV